MTQTKRLRGFTLLELLAVITIIAILATLAAVGIANATKRGRDARRNSDLSNMKTALELYAQDNGSYPAAAAPVAADTLAALTAGGYIGTLPKDPRDGVASPSGQVFRYMYQTDATNSNYAIRAILEYKNTNSGVLANPPFTNCTDAVALGTTVALKGNGTIKGAAGAAVVSCTRLTND
jgi:prepilin-type N-terminal cleavage/methylation domain-containing protein